MSAWHECRVCRDGGFAVPATQLVAQTDTAYPISRGQTEWHWVAVCDPCAVGWWDGSDVAPADQPPSVKLPTTTLPASPRSSS